MNLTRQLGALKPAIGGLLIFVISFGIVVYRNSRQGKHAGTPVAAARPGTMTETTAIPQPATGAGSSTGATEQKEKSGAGGRGSAQQAGKPPAPSAPPAGAAIGNRTPVPMPPLGQGKVSPPTVQTDLILPPDVASAGPPMTGATATRPSATLPPSLDPAPDTASAAGQRSGRLVWSGTLSKDSVVIIEGNHPSSGTLTGELPGLPVSIELNAKNFGVAEAPSPSNGWKRLAFRGRKPGPTVVTITWTALP